MIATEDWSSNLHRQELPKESNPLPDTRSMLPPRTDPMDGLIALTTDRPDKKVKLQAGVELARTPFNATENRTTPAACFGALQATDRSDKRTAGTVSAPN